MFLPPGALPPEKEAMARRRLERESGPGGDLGRNLNSLKGLGLRVKGFGFRVVI